MTMAMERSDLLHRLVPVAVKEADSIDGVESCVDILRYLKSLNLSVKLLSHSKVIAPLNDLQTHQNVTIREEANILFNSWLKSFYPSGTDAASNCNKAEPLDLKKPRDVLKVSAVSNKKQSHDIAVETKEKPFTAKPVQKKKQQVVKVSETPKKKNAKEILELFEIAKKSADAANAKGLLMSKAETSICFDTLTLLLEYPISSTDPDTRKIMPKLLNLTRHKNRKICNAAAALLQHWRQKRA